MYENIYQSVRALGESRKNQVSVPCAYKRKNCFPRMLWGRPDCEGSGIVMTSRVREVEISWAQG